jgi:hypothetical protein
MNTTSTTKEMKKKSAHKIYKSPRLAHKTISPTNNQNKGSIFQKEKTSKFQINENMDFNAIDTEQIMKNKISKIKQKIEQKKPTQNTNIINTNYYKIIKKKADGDGEGMNRNNSNTKITTTINKVQITKNVNTNTNNKTKTLNNLQKKYYYYSMKDIKSEKSFDNKNNNNNISTNDNFNSLINNKKTYQVTYVDRRQHKYTPDKENNIKKNNENSSRPQSKTNYNKNEENRQKQNYQSQYQYQNSSTNKLLKQSKSSTQMKSIVSNNNTTNYKINHLPVSSYTKNIQKPFESKELNTIAYPSNISCTNINATKKENVNNIIFERINTDKPRSGYNIYISSSSIYNNNKNNQNKNDNNLNKLNTNINGNSFRHNSYYVRKEPNYNAFSSQKKNNNNSYINNPINNNNDYKQPLLYRINTESNYKRTNQTFNIYKRENTPNFITKKTNLSNLIINDNKYVKPKNEQKNDSKYKDNLNRNQNRNIQIFVSKNVNINKENKDNNIIYSYKNNINNKISNNSNIGSYSIDMSKNGKKEIIPLQQRRNDVVKSERHYTITHNISNLTNNKKNVNKTYINKQQTTDLAN